MRYVFIQVSKICDGSLITDCRSPSYQVEPAISRQDGRTKVNTPAPQYPSRSIRAATLLVATWITWLPATLATTFEDYPKLAPYPALRWNGDVPEVQVEGRWCELRAIDAIAATDLVTFCKQKYAAKWQKRFAEDLVQVLSEFGAPPGSAVSLTVRDLADGTAKVLPNVPLTEANRNALRDSADQPRGPATQSRPVEPPARLNADQIVADLARLKQLLETRYSYLRLRGVDYAGGLAEIQRAFAAGGDRAEFGIALQQFLSRFGDGHTRIDGFSKLIPAGYAPFSAAEVDGTLLAFGTDGQLLDAAHPVLTGLDGRLIEDWIAAAGRNVTRGSPQLARRESLRGLAYVSWIRRVLELPERSLVAVEVRSRDGKHVNVVLLPLADRPQRPPQIKTGSTRKLDGNIGYLRIPEMDDAPEFIDGLHQALSDFRGTRGLIIDVRGNGGGMRAALRALMPYFMRPDEPPIVGNIAVYRLNPGEAPDRADGYLSNRWLYPSGWSGWTPAERDAGEGLLRSFKPEWQLPAGEFSTWHLLILSRGDDPKTYSYESPVIVLMDEGCFSATDIFLGALKGRPNVTLMGTASGGGSGRAQVYPLPESGLRVALSSMASFRPDGRLYDLRGIDPDVVVPATLDDLLGRTDHVLDAAIALLTPK